MSNCHSDYCLEYCCKRLKAAVKSERLGLSWIPADEPQSWHHQTVLSQSHQNYDTRHDLEYALTKSDFVWQLPSDKPYQSPNQTGQRGFSW
ncbi:Uncharacterised protein [Streptococcus pneumoniae]|nr:Uncharacterised protein [Streptococcus pneumoniae]